MSAAIISLIVFSTSSLIAVAVEGRISSVISGPVPTQIQMFRKLEYFDASANELSGHADLLILPSLKYIDLSINKFVTAGFRRFHKSYHTLQEMDLSSNRIAQDVGQVFQNMPPTLERSNLSNNTIGGVLPRGFPIENQVRFFAMANNNLSGPLPDVTRTFSNLEHINLANNYLTGTIQDTLWKLEELVSPTNCGNIKDFLDIVFILVSVRVGLGWKRVSWEHTCKYRRPEEFENSEADIKLAEPKHPRQTWETVL